KTNFIFLLMVAIIGVRAQSYHVKLITENDEFEFLCDAGQTIYEAAKKHGVDFDFGYDAGATDASLARLNYGIIDLSEQSYLDESQIEEKLILFTVAYPESDCEIDLNVSQKSSYSGWSYLFPGEIDSYEEYLCYDVSPTTPGGYIDGRYVSFLSTHFNLFTIYTNGESMTTIYLIGPFDRYSEQFTRFTDNPAYVRLHLHFNTGPGNTLIGWIEHMHW
ncbi:MAG: hypothetical protein ABFS35_06985, partial [Bacteroidota bacterium]